MSRLHFLRSMMAVAGVCTMLAYASLVRAQQYDPQQPSDQTQADAGADQAPGRVARLAYLSGQVQFAPAGENDWGSTEVNRPMVIGDRLLTGDDGRAVLELGDASVRLDNDSAFDFLNLDQENVQIELSQGTLNLAVHQLENGENFEVDTPTVAFVASAPGIYRIDDSPDSTGSMVTVFRGSGTVYGENGVSRQVAAGTSYRFNDSMLANVEETGLPQADDFDRFCQARDANYQRYAQQDQYVPPDMIGGGDLYQYGQWNDVPEYGNVWYPNSVPAGWAPYRYGHWAWIDPWGWTWVDDQPWGFAPFHYGRWVYARNRWGWMPGPARVRPVYAPALVAFVGGSGLSVSLGIGGGGPVGWFPLGPRDVYVPWFHASQRYFTNVNVTNIRNVYVNRTVINNFYSDYRAGRAPPRGGHDYAYRRMPGAVTAVPRNVFAGARPVHPAVLKLNRNQLARADVALRPGVNPGKASIGLRRPSPRPAVLKGREPFSRPVVARHQPPPRPVEFAAREKLIARQHGQPLTATQMQDLRKTRPANARGGERVKLVPAVANVRRGATPQRPATPAARNQPVRPVAPRPGEPSGRRTSPAQPFKNTVQPIPARNQPVQPARQPGELPSARFAHPGERGTLPRAPVVKAAGTPQRNAPASGRLPIVKPIQRAPQSVNNGTAQQTEARQRLQEQQRQRQIQERAQQPGQQRASQLQMERQARDQQAQQQRTARLQAQQRAREQAARQQTQPPQQRVRNQQAQQQSAIQAQAEQRAREQRLQQQRRVEMQAGQRAREQAVQQQRQMQMQQQQQQQQQRAMDMQRQQQTRERAAQRAPQPRNQPAPQHRNPPPRKRPPPSSGD